MKTNSSSAIQLTRGCLIAFAVFGSIAIGLHNPSVLLWLSLILGLALAVGVIVLEQKGRGLNLKMYVRALFGLLIGIIAASLLNTLPVHDLMGALAGNGELATGLQIGWKMLTYLGLSYLAVVLTLKADHDSFAVVIPYVRFRQTNDSEQQLILDASVLMDKRLVMLLESGLVEGRLITTQYVLDEVKVMADSPSSGKRDKGERGLAVLEQLSAHSDFRLTVRENDETSSSDPMDVRIAQSAKDADARLITIDDTLTKTARLKGVSVLNLEDVALAFKQKINVGEKIRLTITRPGKEDHQGVGYLTDGSMIVVNQASQYMGTTKSVVVISKLQTSSGVMIFAELDDLR